MKYTCKLSLLIDKPRVRKVLENYIQSLKFTPHSMDLFYDEFEGLKEKLPYNIDHLLNGIIDEGLDGISSFTLYDSYYRPKSPSPFFRVKISNSNEKFKCHFEWIGYENLDWLVTTNAGLENALFDSDLLYLYFYNQNDVWNQSREKGDETWGRSLIVHGFVFTAAPIMFFGKACDEGIPYSRLKELRFAEELIIANSEVIRINLFDIYAVPEEKENRPVQKEFWDVLSLEKLAKEYKTRNNVDAFEFLKMRANMKHR
jgi:hypothetical protein